MDPMYPGVVVHLTHVCRASDVVEPVVASMHLAGLPRSAEVQFCNRVSYVSDPEEMVKVASRFVTVIR